MTKRYPVLIAALFILSLAARAQTSGSVGIGTATPDASALLELSATNKGLLLPRLTRAQRDAIQNPAAGLMIYQTDNTPGLYLWGGSLWSLIPASTQVAGDNLGNHTATQTFDLNNKRLMGAATTALGDSTAQMELVAWVPNRSSALLTRSNYGRNYTRAILSGFGMGPYGQEIDYAVWGNAYRSNGWGGVFTAGRPGQPLRWVGLAGHPGFTNANAAIRIVDGTQAAGRVLTSDAVGNGTWQPITAAGGNFNLGSFQLVGNGGSTGIGISSGGNVSMAANLSVAGTASLGWVQVQSNTDIPANSGVIITCACPAGTRLVGGGGGTRDANAAAFDITVHYSGPDLNNPETVWRLVARNASGSSRPVRVYGICARLAP